MNADRAKLESLSKSMSSLSKSFSSLMGLAIDLTEIESLQPIVPETDRIDVPAASSLENPFKVVQAGTNGEDDDEAELLEILKMAGSATSFDFSACSVSRPQPRPASQMHMSISCFPSESKMANSFDPFGRSPLFNAKSRTSFDQRNNKSMFDLLAPDLSNTFDVFSSSFTEFKHHEHRTSRSMKNEEEKEIASELLKLPVEIQDFREDQGKGPSMATSKSKGQKHQTILNRSLVHHGGRSLTRSKSLANLKALQSATTAVQEEGIEKEEATLGMIRKSLAWELSHAKEIPRLQRKESFRSRNKETAQPCRHSTRSRSFSVSSDQIRKSPAILTEDSVPKAGRRTPPIRLRSFESSRKPCDSSSRVDAAEISVGPAASESSGRCLLQRSQSIRVNSKSLPIASRSSSPVCMLPSPMRPVSRTRSHESTSSVSSRSPSPANLTLAAVLRASSPTHGLPASARRQNPTNMIHRTTSPRPRTPSGKPIRRSSSASSPTVHPLTPRQSSSTAAKSHEDTIVVTPGQVKRSHSFQGRPRTPHALTPSSKTAMIVAEVSTHLRQPAARTPTTSRRKCRSRSVTEEIMMMAANAE